MIPPRPSTFDSKSRPARLLAFWLLLLVPAIPVETAFGALACAQMPGSTLVQSATGDLEAHHSHGDAGDHDTEAHLGCTWLGPCSASVAMAASPTPAPTFLEAFSQQLLQWHPVDADLPHPLAYLRPRAIPPPLQI